MGAGAPLLPLPTIGPSSWAERAGRNRSVLLLGDSTMEERAATLLALDCSRVTAAGLCEFGLERIVPIEENTYAEERRQLCALGEIKD